MDKIDFLLYICIFILTFIIGSIFGITYFSPQTKTASEQIDCQNNDLINFSICLSHELVNYKYNLSNQNLSFNIDRLKSEGAVCWQFAEYTIKILKENDFNAERIDMWGNKSGHTVTLAWDKDMSEYCQFSNQYLNGCWRIK